MCGIAGFCGDFKPELLDRMGTLISHRGPDDHGTYHAHAKVGLAHARLSILDLSANGHQPMITKSGNSVISFNGEIYNYLDIRSKLNGRGIQLNSTSDTEVILYLLEEFGPDVISEFNGIFAFAFWNAKDQSLLLCRDQFGVKPLYYSELPHGVLFSSELKSILADPSVSREIDRCAVTNYLTYNYSPGERTMLEAVKKLPPGHAMIIKDGKIQRQWRYYDIPVDTAPFEGTLDQAVQVLRGELRESVRKQLVSDAKVGAFLSGGLDSSVLVALACHERAPLNLPCYTISTSAEQMRAEGFVDDLPYAQMMAKQVGVPFEIVPVRPSAMEDLAFMVYHLDEPQPDLTALNVYYISRAARADGVKVLISGSGGDDVFSGYRRHAAIGLERAWSWMPPKSRRLLKVLTDKLPVRSPLARRIRRAFQYAHYSSDVRLLSYYAWIEPEIVLSILSSESQSKLGGYHPFDPMHQSLSTLPASTPPLTRMLYLEKKHFLGDHNFNYFDKMAMACGVECRVPFLDPDVVRFAESLPPEWKQNGLQSKYILRKMAKNLVPNEIITRKKTGFGPPQREWFVRSWKDSMLRELLARETIEQRGLFDAERIGEILNATLSGSFDGSYVLLGVACIELWCRTFVDQSAPVLLKTPIDPEERKLPKVVSLGA